MLITPPPKKKWFSVNEFEYKEIFRRAISIIHLFEIAAKKTAFNESEGSFLSYKLKVWKRLSWDFASILAMSQKITS